MYELPTELCGLRIRSDYRAILDIIKALDDDELSEQEKAMVTIQILYEDWSKIEDLQEALTQAFDFINLGKSITESKPRLMDWQQDFPIIVTSVNRVLGTEIRSLEHLHWWTFIGAYYEIGESAFSSVVGIRKKKAQGKQLEKYEQEYYFENREMIDLPVKYSEEEKEEIRRYRELLSL